MIEDDPSILSTIADILEWEGYEVETATNGVEGLAAVERAVPSLILLDMRMPVLNGWQFADLLKQRDVRVPIAVTTAAQDARRWADEIGAGYHLAKPFSIADLLSVVEAALGGDKGRPS